MTLPLGKLPPDILAEFARRFAPQDPRVVLGPGVGLDCAVIEFGERMLVAKTDPITITSERIGWYAVHVNANDVATTGARPAWFLVSALLPEGHTDRRLLEAIFDQIESACRDVGAAFVGGHTEITRGLDRPILVGTMLGEVSRQHLITPRGARPGDAVLLTKWIPIEAVSILAADFAGRLVQVDPATLEWGQAVLSSPGISVVKDALVAADTGGVTAMHDPTEGGLAGGLWEMAEAAGVGLEIDSDAIPIPIEARELCREMAVDPLAALASGALLITARAEAAAEVVGVLSKAGIPAAPIGRVVEGHAVTLHTPTGPRVLPQPERDAIAQLFDRLG
jgi:hydrogenase expression/formation protein HypE